MESFVVLGAAQTLGQRGYYQQTTQIDLGVSGQEIGEGNCWKAGGCSCDHHILHNLPQQFKTGNIIDKTHRNRKEWI